MTNDLKTSRPKIKHRQYKFSGLESRVEDQVKHRIRRKMRNICEQIQNKMEEQSGTNTTEHRNAF